MKQIHRKSALPETSGLILGLHDRGEGLLWERYEQQLPLCAFTDNGLSCRRCFNGPCRINPFGDEPSHGVCGADRDQIVMENVFQATFLGVLETARTLSVWDTKSSSQEIPDLNADLPSEVQKRLLEEDLLPVRKHQLLEVQNSYFSHKGYLSRTLIDLARLGLIHYGLLKGASASVGKVFQEVAPICPESVNLVILGQVPSDLIEALKKRGEQDPYGGKINLLTESITPVPSLHPVADHGTPEFLTAMDLDAVIMGPNATFPSLETLARKLEIPAILIDAKKSLDQLASDAIHEAFLHKAKVSHLTSHKIIPSKFVGDQSKALFEKAAEITMALEKGALKGIAVVLGEPSVKQTCFERTLTLLEHLIKEKVAVVVGSAFAAQGDLLLKELARRMEGKSSAQVDAFEMEGVPLLSRIESFCEIPKMVGLLKAMSPQQGFNTLPVVITFPEFFRPSTWATAVSFLSLGFAVQIGTQLPFWGSPSLTEILLQEWPKTSGGTLLASPSLPEGQVQAKEILSLLEERRRRLC